MISSRTREVIEEIAVRHADDAEEADVLEATLAHAVARRLRRVATATKECPSCQQARSTLDFARDARAADGLFWRCRVCDSAARRARS